jgi:hypothetical protein
MAWQRKHAGLRRLVEPDDGTPPDVAKLDRRIAQLRNRITRWGYEAYQLACDRTLPSVLKRERVAALRLALEAARTDLAETRAARAELIAEAKRRPTASERARWRIRWEGEEDSDASADSSNAFVKVVGNGALELSDDSDDETEKPSPIAMSDAPPLIDPHAGLRGERGIGVGRNGEPLGSGWDVPRAVVMEPSALD